MRMDTKNFDSIVKAMMEGAQEEVSSRVWNGVQKGLEAAEALRTRIVYFRRAGYALAAAAAAVVLLLTTGISPDNSIQPTISEKAIALVPELPAVTEVQPQDSGRDELQTPPEAKPATPVKTVKPAAATVATPAAETIPAETVATETIPAEPVATESVKTVPETEQPVSETAADPFARMIQEELAESKKASRNIGLKIGSNFGSNGVRTSAFSQPVRRAQQGTRYRNVIRENGESSYSLPVSFGLGIDIPLSGRFSIGTGLTYTSLSRTFPGRYLKYDDATGDSELLYGDAKHTVKYIGLPVNVYYHFPSLGNFAFYTYGGGEIERSVLNKYRITTNTGNITHRANNTGLQFSVGLGIGAEYKFTRHLGLYLDPSIRYYFDGNQPKSIRTQHPWMFNVEAGLRFNLY